jgi:anti-sigma-K factor RskA
MYDDDRDALAAEYVLGTLSANERDQAEALLAIDPGFAKIVHQWERRLGELNVMVEAVEPPTEIWEKIRDEIAGTPRPSPVSVESEPPAIEEKAPEIAPTTPETAPDSTAPMQPECMAAPQPEPPQDFDTLVPPQDLKDDDDEITVAALASGLLPPEADAATTKKPSATEVPLPPATPRSAEVISLSRKARRWQGMTVAMGVIAALLALFIGVERFAPGLIPLPRHTQTVVASNTQPPLSRFIGVLQHDPTAPAFLLTVDPQNRTITVRRVAATAEADRSYELWLISSKYPAPRSLGVIGGPEFTTRPIPANVDIDTMHRASYAVSLEPSGGSPTGAPTGPVLFTGSLVESVPGSPS